MKVLFQTIRAELLDYSKLSPDEQELLEAARLVRQNAYAPYSHYWVGAAVRSAASGRIYAGCNVEIATYTQTTHAEQSAIVAMIAAEGRVKIAAIAIVAGPEAKEIIFPHGWSSLMDCPMKELHTPCGHCLQIIWEFCFGDPNVVLLGGPLEGGGIARVRIGDAFPMRFGPEDLEVDYSKLKAT